MKPTFDRTVTHEMAADAAKALIARAHNLRDGRKSRMSIPVQADDDDVVIFDYIAQQEALATEGDSAAGSEVRNG